MTLQEAHEIQSRELMFLRAENKRLQKELLEIYMGAYNLKAIEEGLEGELGISKRKARQNLQITPKLQKSHIEKRITELQSKLD